ncbi:hypothetical protein OH809_44540 (plasmid) [Streptomyces sp. NBC_00873]|uniref:hypothetical protein n=1 Tax=unclassified Streptomyces TaxID=2593676 RepID=UPI002F90A294|nr:hypothetical protein OH809_44540 [Streptomyces sp. NBC_00873]WTA49269.1 hypothetical protein OH821_44100 [Streptomyces sp. NBC_00842]
MTTRFLAVFQFREGGPAVTGEWASEATARRTYRGVGLYGSQPRAVIQLIEETAGVRHALRKWTAQGEVVVGPDGPETVCDIP